MTHVLLWKRIIFFIWCAMTLTTLFFHPLITNIHDQFWYLQWTKQYTYEFILAYVLLSVLLTFILIAIGIIKGHRSKLAAAYFIGIIPFMSFGIQTIARLGWGRIALEISDWIQRNIFVAVGIGIIIFLFVVALSYIRPRHILHIGLVCLLILSPLNFLLFWTIGTINHFVNLTVDKSHAESESALPNVYVFLFDELSPDFLYRSDGQINAIYPNIAEFSSVSDNYHQAISPGHNTILSIPKMIFGLGDGYDIQIKDENLVAVSKVGNAEQLYDVKENIFSKAKQDGYTTAIFGYHLQYCTILKNFIDYCHSFSRYNYSTVRQSFSPLNPIITNIILWPRQLPYGWLKRPLFIDWQKHSVEQTSRWTMEAFHFDQPLFLFTHFSVPHPPFVFDRNGFNPTRDPFLQNDENYGRQVEYVDTMMGEFVAELKSLNKFDGSTIVILSDHNYRALFPDRERDVVLIVKHAKQNERKDIWDSTNVSDVLKIF